MSRRGLLAVADAALGRAKRKREGKLGVFETPASFSLPELPDNLRQMLTWEREVLRSYVSGHPLDQLQLEAPHSAQTVNARDHEERYVIREGTWVEVAGVASDVELKKTKRGNVMAIFSIEMLDGVISCISFADNCGELGDGWVVRARGVIDDGRDERTVKVTNIKLIERW